MPPYLVLRAAIILPLLLAFASAGAHAQAKAAPREVVIGYYDAEPSCWMDESGAPRGVFVDLFEDVAARNGWKARWKFREWDELLDGLKSGDIEIVPAIVETAGREPFAIFIEENVMLDWGAVLVGEGSDISTVLDLHRRKVGHLPNDFWFDGPGALSSLADSFGVEPDYVFFDGYGELFAALGAGRIDAAVGSNSLFLINGARFGVSATPIIYNPVELKYAVSRSLRDGPELAAAIDRAVAAIKQETPGRLQAILASHSVPVRAEVVLPRWAVAVMAASLGLLAVMLAVAIAQALRLLRSNRKLVEALRAKDAYLHETHHRVRNNLQLVVSLLRLESDSLADGKSRIALEDAKSRVLAMSIIEENIYEAGDLDETALRNFVEDLVATMEGQFGGHRFSASHRIDLGDDRLPLGSATPLALMMNELVQNSCRHGADDSGRIELEISLLREPGSRYRLIVRDRGPGFPPDFDPAADSGLGFALVNALAAQLGGTLETANDAGAVVSVAF